MPLPSQIPSYLACALPALSAVASVNRAVLERLTQKLVEQVADGKFLLVAGSGHSAIFAMELYHRAGGASFVLPVVDEQVLPLFGPSRARQAERRPDSLLGALNRMKPRPGEMIWICSQSGINPSIVELALESKKLGLFTVAFTSKTHSAAVSSRHVSGSRLMEVCDEVVDLGGVLGDALLGFGSDQNAGAVGPFSTLSALGQAHEILSAACIELEARGVRCVYSSVNTPGGEEKNRFLEQAASARDDRLLTPSQSASG
ncbi:MAG: sugar isomerase domain-containing protein [Oligoflexia bacterium]